MLSCDTEQYKHLLAAWSSSHGASREHRDGPKSAAATHAYIHSQHHYHYLISCCHFFITLCLQFYCSHSDWLEGTSTDNSCFLSICSLSVFQTSLLLPPSFVQKYLYLLLTMGKTCLLVLCLKYSNSGKSNSNINVSKLLLLKVELLELCFCVVQYKSA